jgi:non-heme chloroperoxidase
VIRLLLCLAALLVAPFARAELRFSTIAAPDGVPLNLVEAGERGRPAILFLHGFSQSYLSWLAQLRDPGLAQRYHLIALDLRGHGASGKPWDAAAYASSRRWAGDVAAAIRASGAQRPLIVGWSYGGYVALDFERHNPGAAAGVLLVGSHGGLLPRPAQTVTLPGDDLEAQRVAARGFMAVMSAAPLGAEAVANGEASYLMLPPYARRAFAGRNLDNRDLIPRLRLPVRALVGARDPSVDAADIAAVLAQLPEGRGTVLVPEAGHSPFLEAPYRFAQEVAAFRDAVQ